MIAPEIIFDELKGHGVGLFTGVPDSLLSSFCAYVADHTQEGEHIVTANEGNAVALAAGFHLASGRIGVVYLQNSGLGNAINPLTSLTDPEVYRIPLVLIVGWRGEPGEKDEPQHVKQGRITQAQLDLLGIPYWILNAMSDVRLVLKDAFSTLQNQNTAVALLVQKDTFSSYKVKLGKTAHVASLKREEVLRRILSLIDSTDLLISTTGKTSREIFELRAERNEPQRDFLTVGSMGHTASIALGVALGNPQRRVICLDGDGSVLMHLGALPIIGNLKPANFIHILLNNSAHESVGGQPTVAGGMNFEAVVRGCGYRDYHLATDLTSVEHFWQTLGKSPGPVLLEIKICCGSRDNLGRPTSTPEENKRAFMLAAGL
ncbi:MAG: phosphonopyruvate decarboxylase [Candidatus Accumulibacter propinquus]